MSKTIQEITPIPEIDGQDGSASEETMLEHLNFLEAERNVTRRAARDAVKNLFVLEKIDEKEDLMEIGAGTGFFADLVPRKFRRRLLQTELEPELLAEAQKRFPKGRYKQVDASRMPEIQDDSIDRVFAMNLLNVRYPEIVRNIMSEVRRVLRPGGIFYSIIDLQPKNDAVLWHIARQQNIPMEEASVVTTFSGGFVYCGVSTLQEGASISALFGGGPTQYETGSYFVNNVCREWFNEFFSHDDTQLMLVTGSHVLPNPLAVIRPLVVSNANIHVRKNINEKLIPAWQKKLSFFSRPEHCSNPREIQKRRFGKLRTIEMYGAYVNKGVKVE